MAMTAAGRTRKMPIDSCEQQLRIVVGLVSEKLELIETNFDTI
jgi:hypothetical protein